uniref:BPTI/Kunitz inhibitor domain-containing protein n=1 Tax=Gopherus agassizii TaxID=38772 RepID=A0A452GZ14_9SAUR
YFLLLFLTCCLVISRESCATWSHVPAPPPLCSAPPDFCQLSPDIGPCKAWGPRFFYNCSSQHCELFIYGGCQGNLNNFAEEVECLQACGPPGESRAWGRELTRSVAPSALPRPLPPARTVLGTLCSLY